MIDAITEPVFRFLAQLRGARVFHPRGAAYAGVWIPSDPSPLPDADPLRAGELDAVVRVSRGVGLESPIPDVLGVAVKILDAYGPGHDQDLLLASVVPGRWGTRLLIPRTSFSGAALSSVLPYEVAGRRTLVLGVVDGEPSTSTGGSGDASGLELRVSLQNPDCELSTVRFGDQMSEEVASDLCFDPWNTGESLRPTGIVNRLRRPVYQASQSGRSAPADGVRSRVHVSPSHVDESGA